ncbi:unnamed protein product [Paramecium sonneborni]|uniref:Transmembrane protein n=1 Tax=Paramecium sonneborni TaxID=65129 RepID=A0A8S1QWW2_9CILI|nr:unnamed protein product [Paramecium sonneborni]CAD8119278.1 unnamed protein product [Paramecium sonneborni]
MQILQNCYILKRQDTQDQQFNSQFSSPETDYRQTQKEIISNKSQEIQEKETQQLLYFTPKKGRNQENVIYYTPEIKRKPSNQVDLEHKKFKQIGNILFVIQIIIIILLELMT